SGAAKISWYDTWDISSKTAPQAAIRMMTMETRAAVRRRRAKAACMARTSRKRTYVLPGPTIAPNSRSCQPFQAGFCELTFAPVAGRCYNGHIQTSFWGKGVPSGEGSDPKADRKRVV